MTGVAVVASVVGAAAFWAVNATMFTAATDNDKKNEPLAVEVIEMTVGRSLNLNVTVSQPFTVVGFNDAPGKITRMGSAGEIASGDVLYEVDARPVVAVSGTVPFHRSLELGMTGPDVVQLRAMLIAEKFLSGSADGSFTWPVAAAVQKWQVSLGLKATNSVSLGQVMAIPNLPTTVRFAEGRVLGSTLAGGDPMILGRMSSAKFNVVLNSEQAALIPADSTITVQHEDIEWSAVIASRSLDGNSSVMLELTAPDGTPVCADACGTLPPDEELSLLAQLTLVPPATGPAIPVAAIRTSADQETYVVTGDGAHARIRVLQSDGGFAVVEGLTTGDVVLVSPDDNPTTTADTRNAVEGAE